MNDKSLGQIAFDAYVIHMELGGRPIPTWDSLPQYVRDAFEAAAEAVAKQLS